MATGYWCDDPRSSLSPTNGFRNQPMESEGTAAGWIGLGRLVSTKNRWFNTIYLWPWLRNRLIGGTDSINFWPIVQAWTSGISPQFIWPEIWYSKYLQFRILKISHWRYTMYLAWPPPSSFCCFKVQYLWYLPSGKHTKNYWKWPFIVDLPL